MMALPEEWPDFLLELSELTVLRESLSDFALIYREHNKNMKADLLANTTCSKKITFSFIGTSVSYWFYDICNIFI